MCASDNVLNMAVNSIEILISMLESQAFKSEKTAGQIMGLKAAIKIIEEAKKEISKSGG